MNVQLYQIKKDSVPTQEWNKIKKGCVSILCNWYPPNEFGGNG